MAKFITNASGVFSQSLTLTKQKNTFDIPTAGTFVDKNLQLVLTTQTATYNTNTATVSTNLYTTDGSNAGINISSAIINKVTSEPTSGYYIAVASVGSGSSKITKAGWINTGALTTTTSTTAISYFAMKAATSTNAATGTATINSISFTYNSTNNNFSITGSAAISGTATLTVSQAGYLPKNNILGQTKGIANLNTTVARVGVKSTLNGATSARKPTIERTNTSATGAVNVGSTNATSTAPTSGYFVSMRSLTNTAAITATASVNSNGYGTTATGQYIATNASAIVGAAASDITYIPIKSGKIETPATTITENPTITIATATGKISAFYSTTKSVTPKVTTAGWVTTGTAGTITATGSNTLQLVKANVSVNDDIITINPGWIGTPITTSVATTTVTRTSSVINNNVVTRGVAYWGSGWITADTMTAATFANVPTGNATDYLDISNTGAAPILTSDGYLYINQGYTDKLKISLAKLIPDTATITAGNAILQGISAFDKDGNLMVGTIPINTANNIIVSGQTIYTIPGYYSTTASKSVATGAYAASIKLSAITVTPSVSFSAATTYGFTSTKPSGDVFTITPGVDTPTYYATATASITTAGYIIKGNKYANTSTTVKAKAGTAYYASIVTPTFSTDGLSLTATNLITVTGMATATSGNYYIDAVATGTASMAQIKYSNKAGVITTHTNVQAVAGTNTNVNSTANRVYIKAATSSVTNGTATATAVGGTASVLNFPTATATATGTPKGMDGGYYTDNTVSSYYIEIAASATANSGVIKATGGAATATFSASKAIVTVGYNGATATAQTTPASKNATGSTTQTTAVIASKNVNTKIYLKPATTTISGGDLTSYNAAFTPTVSVTAGANTNMSNIIIGGLNTPTYAYYFKVNATSTGGFMNPRVSRAGIGETRTAGYLPARAATTVIVATTATTTATVNASGTNTYISIKKATFSGNITGGAVSCFKQGNSNITVNTTDSYNNGIVLHFVGSRSSTAIATVTANGAGYTPVALAKQVFLNSGGAVTATYYVQGVELKKPSNGEESKFDITVPNGDTTLTFHFHVDTSGNVRVD